MIKFDRSSEFARSTAKVGNVEYHLQVVSTVIADDAHGSLVPSVEWSVSVVDDNPSIAIHARVLSGTVHVDNLGAAEEHVTDEFEQWLLTQLDYANGGDWHNDNLVVDDPDIPF